MEADQGTVATVDMEAVAAGEAMATRVVAMEVAATITTMAMEATMVVRLIFDLSNEKSILWNCNVTSMCKSMF